MGMGVVCGVRRETPMNVNAPTMPHYTGLDPVSRTAGDLLSSLIGELWLRIRSTITALSIASLDGARSRHA